ncbi:MAG: hypothetical protein ACK5PF_01095, partial [bacterium]
MLLPGRGSHLSALVRRRWRWGTRWWLALWLSFVLAAHLGRTVQLDHCGGCRLVCVDTLESVTLSPLGWVALLRELQRG